VHRAQATRFITISQQMAQEGSGARLAIERLAGKTFIGWCNVFSYNPQHRSIKLGYGLDTGAWHQGFATEAARALLQWAFATLDLNRVQAETDPRNTASNRVLEKLNFIHEGTLRQDCIVSGEVSDSRVYGLLRQDWQPTP
jgi:RimJ/RimL family protein N-acetyltransferase